MVTISEQLRVGEIPDEARVISVSQPTPSQQIQIYSEQELESIRFAEEKVKQSEQELARAKADIQKELEYFESRGESLPHGFYDVYGRAENLAATKLRSAQYTLSQAKKGGVTKTSISQYLQAITTEKERAQDISATWKRQQEKTELQTGLFEMPRRELTEEELPKSHLKKHPSQWGVREIISEAYWEQGILPKSVSERTYKEILPKSLKEFYETPKTELERETEQFKERKYIVEDEKGLKKLDIASLVFTPALHPEILREQQAKFFEARGFEKLKQAPITAWETGKFALLGGFKYTREIGFIGSEKLEKEGHPILGKGVEFVSEYAIPTTPLDIGMIYGGSKVLKYALKPKTISTKILGVQQEITPLGGLQKIRTSLITETKVKRFIGSEKVYGKAESISFVRVVDGKPIQVGKTFTYGVTGEIGTKIPSKFIDIKKIESMQPSFKRVRGFIAGQESIAAKAEIKGVLDVGGVKVSRVLPEGFEQKVAGKVVTFKIKGGKVIGEEHFIGEGFGFKMKQPTYITGRTLTGKKKVVGKFEGLIFKKPAKPTTSFEIISGGQSELQIKLSQQPQEVLKSVQAIQSAISIPSKTAPLVPIKTPPIIKTELQPTIKSTPIIQKTKVDLKQTEKIAVVTKQAPLEISTPRTRERMKLAFKTKQVPVLKQTQALKPSKEIKKATALAQPQISRQKQRQILKQPFMTRQQLSPFAPIITLIPTPRGRTPLPFAARFPKQTSKIKPSKRIIKVRKTKYQPTLRAKAFGIKALTIPKGYFKGAGGIIERPIIKVKKKKKKKKK